jgi:DNA repair protein RecO (recombination protein O)
MLHKTRGIVFRFTKYGETSIIVNIFTELFGLQGYIVNSVRSKSNKSKIALYQPLTLLDLVVYHRAHANLNRIKEVKCLYPFQSISMDVKKSAIAMFINEVVNKTLREESHASEIFEFLYHSIATLDRMKENYESFHLVFMLKLSRYLGFGAHNINEVLGVRVTENEVENLLRDFIQADYEHVMEISNDQRRSLLDLILKFYTDHIDTFGEMRSVQILKEVMT